MTVLTLVILVLLPVALLVVWFFLHQMCVRLFYPFGTQGPLWFSAVQGVKVTRRVVNSLWSPQGFSSVYANENYRPDKVRLDYDVTTRSQKIVPASMWPREVPW